MSVLDVASRRSAPRIGFLGTGWIGRERMAAIVAGGAVAAYYSDPSDACAATAAGIAPAATRVASLEAMLAAGVDGVVIATPSALHAGQAITALGAGAAVFCQKPLGRSADETRNVVAAARAADRLLAVDLSYRHVAAAAAVIDRVRCGALGRVFAVDLIFHNAYGPDKPWFFDRSLAGGGCLIDLGIHLVDLALVALDFPIAAGVSAMLTRHGLPLSSDEVEDYASARLTLGGTIDLRLACSWNLAAGVDAVIEARFYGTGGGAAVRNVGGSFYDFRADAFSGTTSEPLTVPGPGREPWGGRAAVAWSEALASGGRFDPAADRLIGSAAVIDAIYAAASRSNDRARV